VSLTFVCYVQPLLYFFFQKRKFTYDDEKHQFIPLRFAYEDGLPMSKFNSTKGLPTGREVKETTDFYGLNRYLSEALDLCEIGLFLTLICIIDLIFPFQASWSYSKSMPWHHSLCSKCFVSLFGFWTKCGTTHCLPFSC
jgi:hypothetical protein